MPLQAATEKLSQNIETNKEPRYTITNMYTICMNICVECICHAWIVRCVHIYTKEDFDTENSGRCMHLCTNEVRPKYEELKWGRTKNIFFWLDYTKMECIILKNKAVPFWPLGWTFMMTMAATTTNKKKEKTMSVYEKATFHHHLQQRVYCQSCHFQKKILFCTAGSIRSKRVVVYIQ